MDTATAPNHHHDHPGFAGLSGLLAALTFSVGRDRAADLAIDLADLQRGDHVLDVGCGPGVAVRRAAAGGATVVGVDPAAVMLRVARLHPGSKRIRYLSGSAEALPVADASTTVVWSLSTVHHWHDIDAGLAELARVLRPGGRFVAVERLVLPGAHGHASHGWTADQAEAFAARCRAHTFASVEVAHHAGRGTLLSVLAVRA